MKILLAVDGSPCSGLAIAELARLRLADGAIVQIVTVDASLEPSLLTGLPTALDELVRQQRAAATRRLAEAVKTLQQLGPPNLSIVPKLLEGDPKEAIVNEAERWGADLIVVGSHGYGAFRRFLLGSVSEFVANYAPCSVLIARQKPDQAAAAESGHSPATADLDR